MTTDPIESEHMVSPERRTAHGPRGPFSYITFGEGPGLVLAHGTGGTAESNWAHLFDELAHHFTVVAVDLPGSGETPLGDGPLELDELAGIVIAATDAEGLATFRVGGFSLGAVVAVRVHSLTAGRVTGLALIGGWVESDPRVRLQFNLWQHLLRTDPTAAARFLTLTGFSPTFVAGMSDDELDTMTADMVATLPIGMGAQSELDTRVSIADDLASIKVPTAILGMTEDHMVPVTGPRRLAEAIRHASYAETPTGHLVIYERPDLVLQALRGDANHTDTKGIHE
jgi:3-oxoadipate enol-lactonase